MARVIVTAEVDQNKNPPEVTLRGSQRGLAPPKTFSVRPGDALEWLFLYAVRPAPEFRPRVKFVEFPSPKGKGADRPVIVGDQITLEGSRLVENVDPVEDGDVIGGTVSANAFDGDYSYEVQLVASQSTVPLFCVWIDPDGQRPPQRVGMGGGEDSGGPKR